MNGNEAVPSKSQRMALGLDPRAVVIIDMVYNVTLKNKAISFLIKVRIAYHVTSHDHDKSKVKVKYFAITVRNSSMESTLKERPWSDN